MRYRSLHGISAWLDECKAASRGKRRPSEELYRPPKRLALDSLPPNAMRNIPRLASSHHSPGKAPKRPVPSPQEDEEQDDRGCDTLGAEGHLTPRQVLLDERSRSVSSRRSSTTTTSTNKRSRTTSPTKGSMLMSVQYPVDSAILDDEARAQLPEDMRALVQSITDCADGLAVVPQELKSAFSHDPKFRHDDAFYGPVSPRARLGGAPAMRDVERLTARTLQYVAEQEFEPGWNSFLHAPLLDLALSLSVHEAYVDVANITTAQLLDSLKPRLNASLQALTGKIVDFAIVLRRNRVLDACYTSLLLEDGDTAKTFNNTLHPPVMMKPVAISIETKRNGEGGVESHVQLSVWVAAHFQRLGQLYKQKKPDGPPLVLPALPLLLVQGSMWYMRLATCDSAYRTTIYTPIPIGDASKPFGIYQINTALLHLFHWAETGYRRWFEHTYCA